MIISYKVHALNGTILNCPGFDAGDTDRLGFLLRAELEVSSQ
jgi:hypothetical protein